MFRRVRYFFSDVGHWVGSHLPGRRFAIGLGIVVLACAIGAGAYLGYQELSDDEPAPPAAAPEAVVKRVEGSTNETQDLGFPAFATRNTTRVAGADPVADAAAVALATNPSTGGLEGPAAVSMVDVADWPGGIAAASLAAEPVSAPLLYSEGGDLPDLTRSALAALAPKGSADTKDDQIFVIGDGAEPDGLSTAAAGGQNPAEVAAEVAKLREKLTGKPPESIVVTSSDEAAFAMPAAAWAARSGDPVLFAQRDSVPKPTLELIEANRKVPVYVLGPDSAISPKAVDQLNEAGGEVTRIAAKDPVENAVEFARFTDGTFGWNINDPGHGFVLLNTNRPADAGAAAALSASGKWGPALLTDDSGELPGALRGYLLDLKPGYQDDPTRALYNHVWVIGDQATISIPFQAQVDELAELVKVGSGTGGDVLGPPPGTAEPKANDKSTAGGGSDRSSKQP